VKGKVTSAGRLVFFELTETRAEFETGVTLVGKILQPIVMLKTWEITRGKKQRLGTIADLFGSAEFPDLVKTLRTFSFRDNRSPVSEITRFSIPRVITRFSGWLP
jgi:hypothetical protein